jgi:hypothetical protein
MEYEEIINQAASYDNPAMRMLYMGIYGVSIYTGSDSRVNKPFNPILGETFELY